MHPKYLVSEKKKSLHYHRASIHLGPRLAAVADLVQGALTKAEGAEGAEGAEKCTYEGSALPQWTLADIGSDHAYLPAFLLQQGVIEAAIAVDVHEGPYQNILSTVERCGLGGRLEARRGDGLSVLKAGEAQIIVLAGMGGATMAKILRSGEAVVREAQGLVLQPQNAYEGLYCLLWTAGWRLIEEVLAAEGQEIYRGMVWQNEKYGQGWDMTDIEMNIARWREAICPEAEAEVFTRCVWKLGPKNIARQEALREHRNQDPGDCLQDFADLKVHEELLKALLFQELERLARVDAGLRQSGQKENEYKRLRISTEERIWQEVLTWLDRDSKLSYNITET